jgi:hypothetical protein
LDVVDLGSEVPRGVAGVAGVDSVCVGGETVLELPSLGLNGMVMVWLPGRITTIPGFETEVPFGCEAVGGSLLVGTPVKRASVIDVFVAACA